MSETEYGAGELKVSIGNVEFHDSPAVNRAAALVQLLTETSGSSTSFNSGSDAPEAIEAEAILVRIDRELLIEESLTAELMRRNGL